MSDDLAALARLAAHDVDRERAARIRDRCHDRLRNRAARRFRIGPARLRVAWHAVEPAFASGLGALYLLAVLQRAALLLGR